MTLGLRWTVLCCFALTGCVGSSWISGGDEEWLSSGESSTSWREPPELIAQLPPPGKHGPIVVRSAEPTSTKSGSSQAELDSLLEQQMKAMAEYSAAEPPRTRRPRSRATEPASTAATAAQAPSEASATAAAESKSPASEAAKPTENATAAAASTEAAPAAPAESQPAPSPAPSETAVAASAEAPQQPAPQPADSQSAASPEPAASTPATQQVALASATEPPAASEAQQASAEVPVKDATVSTPSAKSLSWQSYLTQTVQALENELKDTSTPIEDRAQRELYLRMLYVLAQRQEQALETVESLQESEQEYWKHQLQSMIVQLDVARMPVASYRNALALRSLRDAVAKLAAASTLDVRNLAFCSQVESFGRYVEFREYSFLPKQEVLLYVELENFASEEVPPGSVPQGETMDPLAAKLAGAANTPLYETDFQGRYEILDGAGRQMASYPLLRDRQICRNRRRDYFIAYRIYMPAEIAPGKYRLHLMMEDLKGQKFGHAALDFAIKSSK